METESEYLTPKEAAELLRLHSDTIYARIKDGSIPSYKIGRQWRVKRSDLETLRTDKEAP